MTDKKYDEAFKKKALALSEKVGLSEAAKQLKVAPSTISGWKNIAKGGTPYWKVKAKKDVLKNAKIKEMNLILGTDGDIALEESSEAKSVIKKLRHENTLLKSLLQHYL